MNSIDTVKALMKAVEDRDWDKAESYLSDDFQFVGPILRQPVGRATLTAVDKALASAFPDLSYNVHQAEELPDGRVSIVVNFTGTHTGELIAPMQGVPPIPPTGKHITLPEQRSIYTVRNGKVVSTEVESVLGTGLVGILAQLGVELPVRAAH